MDNFENSKINTRYIHTIWGVYVQGGIYKHGWQNSNEETNNNIAFEFLFSSNNKSPKSNSYICWKKSFKTSEVDLSTEIIDFELYPKM